MFKEEPWPENVWDADKKSDKQRKQEVSEEWLVRVLQTLWTEETKIKKNKETLNTVGFLEHFGLLGQWLPQP